MKSTRGTNIIVIGIGIILLIILYYIFNPERGNLFPSCPFQYLTGYECPGCGSQRALHYLLHFDIGKAFQQNPLFVLAVPYLAIGIYMEYLNGKIRYPKIYRILFGRRTIIVITAIVILYWIGRNIL